MKHSDSAASRYRRQIRTQNIVICFLLGLNIASWVFFAAVVNSFSLPYTHGDTVQLIAHDGLLKGQQP